MDKAIAEKMVERLLDIQCEARVDDILGVKSGKDLRFEEARESVISALTTPPAKPQGDDCTHNREICWECAKLAEPIHDNHIVHNHEMTATPVTRLLEAAKAVVSWYTSEPKKEWNPHMEDMLIQINAIEAQGKGENMTTIRKVGE
jgi:hypothetical protein